MADRYNFPVTWPVWFLSGWSFMLYFTLTVRYIYFRVVPAVVFNEVRVYPPAVHLGIKG